MNHERTIEYLPWLLNGTLADDERREVEEHLAACAECRAELTATRQACDIYGAHLAPQVLTAYAEATDGAALSVDGVEVDRRVVEEHLALCAACNEDLEMVRAAWTAMDAADSPHLPANVAAFRPATPPSAAETAEWGWRSFAVAASLLLAVLAVGWFFTNRQLAGTQRELAELRQELTTRGATPPATAAADPGSTVAGSAEAPTAAELAAARDRIAELETSVGQSEGQIASLNERVNELAAASTRARSAPYVVPAQISGGEVVRGATGPAATAAPVAPAAPIVYLAPSVPAGRLAGLGQVGYSFFGPDGESVESGRLAVYVDPEVGPLVTLAWPIAGRAAGRYTLILATPDGDEIGRYAFELPG
jgi:predicted anti-sigma-YlaC factor YlaD